MRPTAWIKHPEPIFTSSTNVLDLLSRALQNHLMTKKIQLFIIQQDIVVQVGTDRFVLKNLPGILIQLQNLVKQRIET
jgi:hypothetical protein